MRIGRDFWIEPGGYRRVFSRIGGIRGASEVEVALWDRLASEKVLPRTPRWYFEALKLASPGSEGGDVADESAGAAKK